MSKELVQPIYQPLGKGPMNILAFGSGSGTNLQALLHAEKSPKAPSFKIKALFADRQCPFQNIGKDNGIPVIYHSFIKFFSQRGVASHQDPDTRRAYDEEALRLILSCSESCSFKVDLIVLAGYMRMITLPLLNYFENKIINVHPADLASRDETGRRRYVGASSVYDALAAGETKTRSSVILVDDQEDNGPVLVSGPWVKYGGKYPVSLENAKLHQEKQKSLSDWPACIKAVALIAEGRLGLDAAKRVYLDGILLNQEGASLCAECLE